MVVWFINVVKFCVYFKRIFEYFLGRLFCFVLKNENMYVCIVDGYKIRWLCGFFFKKL